MQIYQGNILTNAIWPSISVVNCPINIIKRRSGTIDNEGKTPEGHLRQMRSVCKPATQASAAACIQ